MKIKTRDEIIIIEADEGRFLTDKKHSFVSNGSILLGIYDSPSNYYDISAEEAKAIQAELDAAEELATSQL